MKTNSTIKVLKSPPYATPILPEGTIVKANIKESGVAWVNYGERDYVLYPSEYEEVK